MEREKRKIDKKMDESIIKQKIEMESKLVRNESISILNEFEGCEDLSMLENYSLDDFELSDE